MRLAAHHSRLAIALVLATAPLEAQLPFLFSPPQLKTTEGDNYCYEFGGWPNLRYQMVDGESVGETGVLKDIALRLDHRQHTSFATASGRTWNEVKIQISAGDVAATTSNFASNPKSTPALVFQSAVSWPHFNGTPLTRPALWGGLSGAYRFPFATPFAYDGKQHILTDWTFTGGTLHNGAAWPPKASTGVPYWFDGYADPTEPTLSQHRYLPKNRLHNGSAGVTRRCNDSFFGNNPSGPYSNIFAQAYGEGATNVNWRNKLKVWSTSHFTAPDAYVVHAWGFVSNDIGTDVRTGCNRLHMTGPIFYLTHRSKPVSADPSGYTESPVLVTPWLDVHSALKVIMQAGWTDSVTGQLHLTQADEAILPRDKPFPPPVRAAVFRYDPGGAVVGPTSSFLYNPVLRYAR